MSTLYIFGSGASKCAGLPTTEGFLETIIHEKMASSIIDKAEANEKRAGPFRIPKDYHKSFLERYQKFCSETQKRNIEDYIIWHKKMYSSEYDKELMWLVNWYFFDRIYHTSTIRYHQIFIEKILKPGDHIFYFNYDLIIDEAFKKSGATTKGGAIYDMVYVKNSIQYRLYKPMGSINLHTIERDVDNRFDGIFLANGYTEVTYTRFVMKWFGIPKEGYEGVYKDCAGLVKKCDKIISLGYSFPQTDKEELDKIFGDCEKEIELICGKDYIAPWTNRIQYKNLKTSFEEWVLENAK